ncbi:potassium channel family protein [Gudongella oleilytica]|uniref:potassium channel family protein n=1 Tax=Gudongella oleilytica TaxID=1582259 RepID=UPI000FF8A43A|nr:TrkA family potassium uptake protein [Gudongella oleilytica]
MKSFAIIGCGRFGSAVARTLHELGNEVLAIDGDPDVVEMISPSVTHAIQADVMDEAVMKELGLKNFDVVIVSIGTDLQASIMATLIVKELGVKHVVTKAQSELHGKVLRKIGADKVIYPERDMGVRVAHNLTSKSIIDYIELSPDYSILEIRSLERWWGKTLSDLRLRNKYGVNVMAIKRGDQVNVSPGPNDKIETGDILVVLGSTDEIAKLEQKAGD